MENKFQDPVFGDLVWEEKYDWWKGKTEIRSDLAVNINLSGNQKQIVEEIDQFRQIFEKLRQGEEEARIFASEKLLELHNESWRDDDEEIVTQQEFIKRIKPESIIIYDDKSTEIYYQDDDMFWGHVIIVSVDEKGDFSDANIAG